MHEEKLSQTESRRLTAYLRDTYKLGIGDALSFWRMTPTEIESRLFNRFGMTITAGEIESALGRSGVPLV